MPDENAKAQMQRFVSLVCRYPFFQLDEEEEEEEMEEYFRRRMKWEVNVLSKRGGFDEVIFNRFFPTEKYANLEEGKDDAEGFRGLCVHHSMGHNAEFQNFVTGLLGAISEMVKLYDKMYDKKSISQSMVDLRLYDYQTVMTTFHALGAIGAASSGNPVSQFLELRLTEDPITCAACRLTLIFSQIETICVLIHLSDVVPQNGVMKYQSSIFEQLCLTCPILDRECLDEMYDDVIRFETEVDKRVASAAPTLGTSSSTMSSVRRRASPTKESRQIHPRSTAGPSTSTSTQIPPPLQQSTSYPIIPIAEVAPSRPRSPRRLHAARDPLTPQSIYLPTSPSLDEVESKVTEENVLDLPLPRSTSAAARHLDPVDWKVREPFSTFLSVGPSSPPKSTARRGSPNKTTRSTCSRDIDEGTIIRGTLRAKDEEGVMLGASEGTSRKDKGKDSA